MAASGPKAVRWPQKSKVESSCAFDSSILFWPWPGQESWTLISFRLRIPKEFYLEKSRLERKEHLLTWDLQQRFRRCWVNSHHTFCALEQVNHLTCVGSELLIYKRKTWLLFSPASWCLDCKLLGAEALRGAQMLVGASRCYPSLYKH